MSEIYIPTSTFANEKAKILSTAKTSAVQGMAKTASAVVREQDPYPTPYLNLSDYQIPRTMNEIFKWCRYFYKFDSLVGGAVNALAKFPITDILFDDMKTLPKNWDTKQPSPSLTMYTQMFDELKIQDLLAMIGIDYWLYGNAFVIGEFENKSPDPEAPDFRWKSMIRLDPAKMTIDVDPLTQEKTYKWDIPAKIKRLCKERKPIDKYNQIPEIIKKAARENKALVLNSKNIYHLSREGESGDGSVWGTPLMLNVMKQLAYRNLLRQAQEAIAREHIVPFRIYYLEPTDRMDPMANWTNVAESLARHLEQAAKDPNYKVVSPIPVNVLNLGGQGRSLLLTPEIDQLQSEILAGMGVPREFIFGGVSYSGSSISLRTLENLFISFRNTEIDFMNNFVIRRMAEVRQEWRGPEDNGYLVTVKMSDLKMQDDVQQKQLIINLNASNKISDDYLYNSLGIDTDKMKLQIEVETFEHMELERRVQLYEAETQFVIQQMQIQYQANLLQMQQQMGLVAPPGTVFGPDGQPVADPALQQQQAQAKQQQHAANHPDKKEDKKEGPKKETTKEVTKEVHHKDGGKEVTKEVTHEVHDSKDSKDSKDKSDSKDKNDSKDKPDTKDKKDIKKKSFEDYMDEYGINKVAEDRLSVNFTKSPATMLHVESIARQLVGMDKSALTKVLDKMTANTRPLIEQALDKLAAANPNTVAASGARNIALGQMKVVDRMAELKVKNKQLSEQGSAANTDNAMMPLPMEHETSRRTSG